MRSPQQDRSRRTLDKILTTSLELLGEGGWDAVTVNELGRRGGISRGAFYARFPSRDVLLASIRQHVFESIAAEHTASLSRDRSELTRLRDVIQDTVDAIAGIVQRWGPILLVLETDAESQAAGAASISHVHEDWARVLLSYRAEITSPDPETAVSFALMVVFATCIMNARVGGGLVLDDAIQREQLVAMVVAHLTAPPQSRG